MCAQTDAAKMAIQGEEGVAASEEGMIFSSGHMSTPHGSGRAQGLSHPTSAPSPFATDDQPQQQLGGFRPPLLISAVSSTTMFSEKAGLRPPPPVLPAMRQPSSMSDLVGDVGAPSPHTSICGEHAGLRAAPAGLAATRQPNSLADLIGGDVGEPSRRGRR